MKALCYNGKASYPDLQEVLVPATPDLSRVKLIASALNHRDLWILNDQYAHLTPGSIMGADGVGYDGDHRVLIYPAYNWGSEEMYFDSDFRVLGMPDAGTFAPYIDMPKGHLYIVPEHLTDEEAAALPLVGLTAYRALVVQGKCTANSKVLITGIGGGVATMAMQMAVALGAQVSVTTSSKVKAAKALSLGATAVYDYTKEGWQKGVSSSGISFDVIVDGAAGPDFGDHLRLVAPGGRIVVYGGTAGKMGSVSPQLLFWKQVQIIGSTMGSPGDFEAMLNLVDKYKVRPIIDAVYEWDDFKLAFDRLRSGNHFGKVVLLNN